MQFWQIFLTIINSFGVFFILFLFIKKEKKSSNSKQLQKLIKNSERNKSELLAIKDSLQSILSELTKEKPQNLDIHKINKLETIIYQLKEEIHQNISKNYSDIKNVELNSVLSKLSEIETNEQNIDNSEVKKLESKILQIGKNISNNHLERRNADIALQNTITNLFQNFASSQANFRINDKIIGIVNQIKSLENLVLRLERNINQSEKIKPEKTTIKIPITDLSKKQTPQTSIRIKPAPKNIFLPSFEISKTDNCLFKNEKSLFHSLEKIYRFEEIFTFLENNPSEESAIYKKNIEQYLKKIKSFEKKMSKKSIYEDEFSEEVTSSFIKILGNYLLDKVLSSIYNGLKHSKDKERYYKKLLMMINKYLSSIYCYSHTS